MTEEEPEPSAEPEQEQSISLNTLYQTMAAAGLGTYFSLIIPPGDAREVAGAVAIAAVTPMVAHIRQEWSRDQLRNGNLLVDSACETGNMTAEQLLTAASQSPKSRLLFMKALDAAANTAWDEKVKTLGAALVNGLIATDTTVFDINQKIISAIADMDEAELCLLDFIVSYEPPLTVADTGPRLLDIPEYSHIQPYTHNKSWKVVRRQWSGKGIIHWRPRLAPVLPSVYGTLERHGLIRWDPNAKKTMDKITEAWRKDINRIRESTRRGNTGNVANLDPVYIANTQPTVEPTELGELVWLKFRDAGASVPDVWTQQRDT